MTPVQRASCLLLAALLVAAPGAASASTIYRYDVGVSATFAFDPLTLVREFSIHLPKAKVKWKDEFPLTDPSDTKFTFLDYTSYGTLDLEGFEFDFKPTVTAKLEVGGYATALAKVAGISKVPPVTRVQGELELSLAAEGALKLDAPFCHVIGLSFNFCSIPFKVPFAGGGAGFSKDLSVIPTPDFTTGVEAFAGAKDGFSADVDIFFHSTPLGCSKSIAGGQCSVPEPSAFLLLGGGLLGAIHRRLKR